jgi:hypothetical protein
MPSTEYALNTLTNRMVKVGSKTYIRLKKLGHIAEDKPDDIPEDNKENEPTVLPESPPSQPESKPVSQSFDEVAFKKLMGETMTSLIAENKSQFKNTKSQDDSDALLKQLLMKKLNIVSKESKPKAKKSKKLKKVKKSKFKMVSSESDSESDSSSE